MRICIKYSISIILFLFIKTDFAFAQQLDQSAYIKDSLRIMFYNVENLFDPFDDSLKMDDEFTYEGARHWSWNKYQAKLNNIYKVIVSAGNPFPPAIIGLCEVENRFVLNQLVYKTPFAKLDYRIVHEESPDRRGIDVGLLFDPKRAVLIEHKAIPICFPFSPNSKTRDILYAKLEVFQEDTIHIFVNHWPSRYGGQIATDPKRKYVAEVLKSNIDSINQKDSLSHIIIMGDFNDEPEDKSVKLHLNAGNLKENKQLINLMSSLSYSESKGSHKYAGHWSMIDQFIISKSLILPSSKIIVKNNNANIFEKSFLLEDDSKYLGKKPFRTFIGFKYNGGYSDHLPIFIDLHKVL